MAIVKASEIYRDKNRKLLLFGLPKGSGKTTFALSKRDGVILDLQYDTGNPSIPPARNRENIYVKIYPDITDVKLDSTKLKWDQSKEVAGMIMDDINIIYDSFKANKGEIKLDGQNVPLPELIVLDGLVPFGDFLISWLCALNNYGDPYDAGRDTRKFWGSRAAKMMKLLRKVISLPCDVALCTWQSEEKIKDANGEIIGVKAIWPDVGGQMDWRTTGLVDASLYCYSKKIGQETRYFIRTKPDGIVLGAGVRDYYDLKDEVDVTIKNLEKDLPWEMLFGGKK